MTRVSAIVAIAALAAAAAGCGGRGAATSATGVASAASCPKAWAAGWQKLANDVGSPVYCPRWMPYPLDGKIDGAYKNGRWVDRTDKSYLVSFLWVDSDAGISGEVHVNFRGYPGRSKIPTCQAQSTANGKTVRKPIPCFDDLRQTRRIGGKKISVYTVNQGIDAWHVLFAWRASGSLYTVSEHVVRPYTYKQVIRNLDRMVTRLVRVEPVA
jgi:hypothetical protein